MFQTVWGGHQTRAMGQESVIVYYANTIDAFRALGRLLRLDRAEVQDHSEEHCQFRTSGVMIDCSRNAVMKKSYVLWLLRRLALAGLNTCMLYTEDTYEVPNHPFFGYMRGT